jgi:hypothetical protein
MQAFLLIVGFKPDWAFGAFYALRPAFEIGLRMMFPCRAPYIRVPRLEIFDPSGVVFFFYKNYGVLS